MDGQASFLFVRVSGGKLGGDFVVFLRFVEHQLASASWCCSASGYAFAAASFSQITSASVLRYGVKPNGERVPRWTWYGQKENVSGGKVIRIFCVW